MWRKTHIPYTGAFSHDEYFCLFKMLAVISLIPQVTRAGHKDDDVSFAPEGYVLKWEDTFDGAEINRTNWVIAR